jgi:type VI secretion system protein ImpG
VVNLFERVAEPVQLSHRQPKYRVAPDYRRPNAFEVYSIDDVYTADSQSPKHFRQVYDLRHGQRGDASDEAYWYASRVESHRPDDHGTDVFLHPVDPNFNPTSDGQQTLVVRTTCTNRDLPIHLQHAGERLRFELESVIPLRSVTCLRTPTTPLRPPRRRGAQWRLISHLALNHLSLSTAADANGALSEMLRLYDFSDPDETQQLNAVNGQWTRGINRVSSRRVTGRIGGVGESGICRGVEIAIDLDEEQYAGAEFLFASVLERFLALYASMNSFTQLVATKNGGESLIRRWPPRAGETLLL